MKEENISLETSKLAHKKGFDLVVEFCYIEGHGDKQFPVGNEYHAKEGTTFYNFNEYDGNYSICSQSLMQKWIREVHNIHISVDYGELSNKYYVEVRWMRSSSPVFISDMKFLTYELALEEGIKESLKLIK